MKTVKHLSDIEVMQLLGGNGYHKTPYYFTCVKGDSRITIRYDLLFNQLVFEVEEEVPDYSGQAIDGVKTTSTHS